jgi:hypothetical protein
MKRFNKIVNGFNKTITKLENLVSTCANRVTAIEILQDELTVERKAQSAEATAAQNVAAKLKDLIGSDD